MPIPGLKYNANEQEHKTAAQTLGQLQGGITKKTYTKDSSHAYYAGHELRGEGEAHPSRRGYYLKMDCPGKSRTTMGRTQNRVVVPVDRDGNLIEDVGYFWRHDNRILKLDAGFFTEAKTMRSFLEKLK